MSSPEVLLHSSFSFNIFLPFRSFGLLLPSLGGVTLPSNLRDLAVHTEARLGPRHLRWSPVERETLPALPQQVKGE